MGETVKEVLEQCKWLISKGREGESAKLLLPRIAAKRRAANKEKRTRVQFDCTPEQYAAFHKEFTRFKERCVNITIAIDCMNELLEHFPDSMIDEWRELDAEERHRSNTGSTL